MCSIFYRVTLDFVMLWSFSLIFICLCFDSLYVSRALSHNETGLGFSAEQRVLPLCLKMYYELFTYSETLEIHGRSNHTWSLRCISLKIVRSSIVTNYMVYPFVNQKNTVKPSENDQAEVNGTDVRRTSGRYQKLWSQKIEIANTIEWVS